MSSPAGLVRVCPGRCGRRIPGRQFACLVCWRRLPPRFRAGIAHGDRSRWSSSAEAGRAAARWLAHHPPARRLMVRGDAAPA